MAGGATTLYRFKITVSDVERGFYDDIDFRVAMHPSENEAYLLTRVLAFALHYESGLEFCAGGLSSSEEPALQRKGPSGIEEWIEIGNPSPRKLHKGSKAARAVFVYTYKDPEQLKREAAKETIHRAEDIRVFALAESFLTELATHLKRDNPWGLIRNDGELVVTVGQETVSGTLVPHRLISAI
jgi:uncharacterized protein YaeQ